MPRRVHSRNPVPNDSLQQSCPLCRLPDNNDMVSCDDCERWYHFDCVGVNEDVANREWSCQECNAARVPAPQPLRSITPGEPIPHPRSPVPLPVVPTSPVSRSPVPPVPTPRTPIAAMRSPLPNLQPPTPRPRTPRSPYPQPASQFPLSPRVAEPDVPIVFKQVVVDPDLVKKLPIELRTQLLQEEEAIERKFLLRRFQLLLDSSGNANPVPQSNSDESALARNNVSSRPAFHSSPVSSHRRNIPTFAPSPVHRDRNEPTFVPLMEQQQQQQLDVPVEIPSLSNNRPELSLRNPPRTYQRANVTSFNPPLAYQRPNALTFAPIRTDPRPHIPAFSQVNSNPHANVSAFAPYAGPPRPTVQEYYPYDSHDYPSAIGGTALLNRSQIAARHVFRVVFRDL